ncbi:hypothetical protein RvY_02941-2 [Ramazzottius varieornatus]|uniref:Uncharacterized protein n=1 Tax=Ramazzottius varieornatus TaxID=947166 RepID=A0A1D1UWJ4_RAMVA|nr:hypothetical protein RvY_02941-2 [Ramazzottius varieornatus]
MVNMPARKEDAHRALQLLEEYHARLSRPQDQQLRQAVEQVIKIFKSSLFQALLDIQEFYDATLMNDAKSTQQKTREALQMSSKFQNQSPFYASASHRQLDAAATASVSGGPISNSTGLMDDLLASPNLSAQNSTSANGYDAGDGSRKVSVYNNGEHSNSLTRMKDMNQASQRPSRSSFNSFGDTVPATATSQAALDAAASGSDFEYQEIILERGATGLGFSISGGNDNPHVDNDPSIYISKIIEGGAAQLDGRLKVGDTVLQINDDAVVDVDHEVAVAALRRAGNILTLRIKRRKPQKMRFDIVKGNRGLGISIAGGIGNQHVLGDNGIFITKIVEGGAAWVDGRLQVEDKILAVGETDVRNCQHDFAVNVLKSTGETVTLHVERAATLPESWSEGIVSSSTPSLVAHSGLADGLDGPIRRDSPAQRYPSSSNFAFDSPAQRGRNERSPTPGTRSERSDTTEMPVYKAPVASTDSNEDQGEPSRELRTVVLTKGPGGLGFNIVGGEEGEGIYISYIIPGGSCDLNGQLKRGDRIISVNGINIKHASHEDAAEALKGAGNLVTIVAQYRPEEYQIFEDKIQEIKERMINASTGSLRPSMKRTLYVRAQFDYDPSKDSGLPSRGLPFCIGDVLHVTNASDDEWWQAKRINADGVEEGLGIIPSRQRYERKERARLKSVKFEPNDSHNKSASTSTLDRFTGKKKEKDKDKNGAKKFTFFKGGKEHSGDDTSESDRPEETIHSYEPVAFERLRYVRPVIVMGPLKDRISDDLIAEFPDTFASCVPHTTRFRRENEGKSLP